MTASELFSQIEQLVPRLEGWCSVPKATQLAATVIALKPAVSVEIGVFGGRSFFPLALAHKFIGHGRAIGIDPWDKKASEEEMTGANRDWWGGVDHESIYRRFMDNLEMLQLRHVTEVIRARSDAAPVIPEIDLLHIDGSHGFNAATSDATRFGQQVRKGGFVFVDDINWEGHGPENAIKILQSLGFSEVYRYVNLHDNWAVFRK
jgi:hypothetical protein